MVSAVREQAAGCREAGAAPGRPDLPLVCDYG